MTVPSTDYPPAAICDDCVHPAIAHGEDRCNGFTDPMKKNPCPCKGVQWVDLRRVVIDPANLCRVWCQF